MTELLHDVLFTRAIERWLIILGAIFLGYLGYKLFNKGIVDGDSQFSGSSQFVRITFSGKGPGLFFMFFAAIILTVALFMPATRTVSSENARSQSQTLAPASSVSKSEQYDSLGVHKETSSVVKKSSRESIRYPKSKPPRVKTP